MSCEKCGGEVKNYGVFLGGFRCRNFCNVSEQGGKHPGKQTKYKREEKGRREKGKQ